MPADHVGETYETPARWLRYLGIARIGVLSFVIIGAAVFDVVHSADEYLVALYAFGLVSSIAFVRTLDLHRSIGRMQTWAQVLVDFSVVALTVALTQGPASYFTFLFIVVVLEAGLLLGLRSSFVFATMASAFMLVQWVFGHAREMGYGTLEVTYNFLVQFLAFYLTAFVASYWNQRVTRMQAFQREIVDKMNSGFLVADAEGRIVIQNRAADEILRIEPGTAIGRRLGDVIRSAGQAESPVENALRRERDYSSYEFRTERADGTSVPIGLTTNCIHDRKNSLTGIIASFTDLTEINRMRDEARKHDRMAVVGELAAGLAHEIRNPLAVIRGSIDELRTRPGEGPVQERLREMILRESHHLDHIVSGFLDFARNPSVVRDSIDMSALLHDVVDGLYQEFDQSGEVIIDVRVPQDLPTVSGDAAQLKQVFVNIAKNGIEASGEKCALLIEAQSLSGRIEIHFDDEGPGIDPSNASRIFEPFYTTKDEGVGMGLAVCLRIITAHDGTIEVANRKGGGCSMRVVLPAE